MKKERGIRFLKGNEVRFCDLPETLREVLIEAGRENCLRRSLYTEDWVKCSAGEPRRFADGTVYRLRPDYEPVAQKARQEGRAVAMRWCKDNTQVQYVDAPMAARSLFEETGRENCEVLEKGVWVICKGSRSRFWREDVYRIKPSYRQAEEPLDEEVLFQGRATVVFWKDGTKTVAKVSDDDTFDPVYGYLICHYMKTSGLSRKEAREWFDYLREVYSGEEL